MLSFDSKIVHTITALAMTPSHSNFESFSMSLWYKSKWKDEPNLAKNVSFFFNNNKFWFVRNGVVSTSRRCIMKDCKEMIHTDANGDVYQDGYIYFLVQRTSQ